MSTFTDLLRSVKEICDSKDREIEDLKGQIESLKKERKLIAERLKEGYVKLVIEYLT